MSALLALLDMAGVVAMLPMMQYVTGQPLDAGALGFVNRALDEPPLQVLVGSIASIIVSSFILKDIAALLVRRWQLSFMANQQVTVSTALLEGYLTGPYSWHLRENTSDKLWMVSGAVGIGYAGGLTSALAAFTEILTIGFIFVSLLFISPEVSVAAALYFGLAAWVVQRMIRPRIVLAGQHTLDASKAVARASLQSLTAVKEIKLRQAHAPFVDVFRAASQANAEAGARAGILNEVPKYFLEIVFVLGVGLLAVAATSASSGADGLVLLGIFVAAGTRILPSCVRLINALAGIRFARAPLEHMVRIHQHLARHRAEELAAVITDRVPAGDLRVEDLRFAYPGQPDTDVLRGVDVDIPVGSSLAIVGSSGAGKSTLVDILLGLHRPSAGLITAGGVPVFDNLPAWQRQLAVVPQEVMLLDGTIRENIAFDEEVDEQHLARAVARAQLADLIDALPEGLDSEAGERGMRLSGGQRQRIGIARALYRDPSLLVLDEATSALDNETERRLTETIESLKGSVTMVIVAHRLSTVRHCDALAFMRDGRVVSYGTFEQVQRDNAEFAHLVALGSLDQSDPYAARGAQPLDD
ncbi:ABC transporter ATP-binding protein [Nocardioides sp.]|uniref:ABC transporter ATP-binding protein n=1 Tax=Nocardioides sp. TaxID=35761 RepID=UPI002BFAFB21|nr:ABC transporter ATP-binding protein [Nocardioides sp.]HXH77206.1 ABC transporter ATP-binding protein [Nocardioides sp.]